MPNISFVIPAYNEEKYVGKCLESILAELKRTPTQAEVIVVNNASTDNTKAVALTFPGVKVVDEPKKGLVAARQAGFTASSGKLIANVDADSILPEGWLAQVLKEFQNPSLAGLSGPFIYYDLPVIVNVGIRLYYYVCLLTHLINNRLLKVGSVMQGGNIVVSRWALEKIGGYNLSLDFWGEDADLARRLTPAGKIIFSLKLPMYSSGRRLKNEGVLTMMVKYPVNYFATIFNKKPVSTNYSDVRSKEDSAGTFTTTVKKFQRVMLGLKIMLIAALAALIIIFIK